MATAFAVFCATDGSLIFYNRDTVPTAGDTFEGKIASNVYTGFENINYTNTSAVPWHNEKASIISVSFTSEFATVKPISIARWFYNATNMIIFNSANFDTSNVTDMSYMFSNCKALTSLDLSSFDTSNVTNMSYMFGFCRALTSLDVSNFDTSKVISMSGMFCQCTDLTSLDVSNFDTSNVEYMDNMFETCSALTTLNVSNFDTSNVTNMESMFYNCNVTSLDLSSFNTSNVTDMSYMFSGCDVTSLDLSSFNTSNVTDMECMFRNCYYLKTIYVLDLWTTAIVTNSNSMFTGCTNLVGAISYDSSKIDVTYANYTTGYLTDKSIYMLIKDTTLYRLADKIRVLNDNEVNLKPQEMVSAISDIFSVKGVQF